MSEHSVEGGKIKRLSVSQIETFDPITPFGCNRRWWFKYVAHMPDPGSAATGLGTQVHAEIERYLKTGENCLGKIALEGKHLIDAIKPHALLVEHEMKPGELDLLGIPFAGKIDVVCDNGLVDWKTS